VCELTWNTFRDHFILEYEIPKYDADLRSPNFFVPLSEAHARKKVKSLMRYFTTQQNKQWFSEELFYGLMRLRATEAASATRYAEAFYCRKCYWNQEWPRFSLVFTARPHMSSHWLILPEILGRSYWRSWRSYRLAVGSEDMLRQMLK
jgi:hypothetical protein